MHGMYAVMRKLSAGCFRDMSRVAASSPEMWEQISLSNSAEISNLLGQYIEVLNDIKKNLDAGTEGYVSSMFEASREYRKEFIKNTSI